MNYLPVLSEWSHWVWLLVLNHLWQATIFFLITLMASLLVRRGPARARYLLWLVASLKFAVPSAVIIFMLGAVGVDVQSIFSSSYHSAPTFHYLTPVVSPLVIPDSYLPSATKAAPTSKVSSNTLSEAEGLSLTLVTCFVWFAGGTLFFWRWLKRRREVARAVKRGHLVCSGREWEALLSVTSWLGFTRRIKLVATSEVREPGVWGVFAPTVLLPEAISNQLDDDELKALLTHEMAHVLRWDNLVSNLNMILCCVFWFNPILWLIDHWLLKEREEACDDVVLTWTGAGETYASSIKKIYRFCLSAHISGLSAAGGSKLRHRLDRILNGRAGKRFSFAHRILVALVMFGSIVLTILAGMAPAETFIARTNSVFRQEVNNLGVQTISRERTECAETTLKPCTKPPTAAIAAESSLGRVVVRSTVNSPLETGTATIANPNQKPLSKPPEAIMAKANEERAPVFQSSHASDLKRFTGRYAVDPSVMENFVLDVNVEDGELWLKPSHAEKRRLLAQSVVEYIDSKSPNTRINFNLDSMGNVESLTLRGWGPTIVAPHMVLPAPSREGNVTFTLDNFSDARIVAVAGTFNGWNQSQYLFARNGGQWVCRINLPPGKYQYKFIVDGNWLVDPNNPIVVHDRRGFENSELTVHLN